MMSGRYAALDILMRIDAKPALFNEWLLPVLKHQSGPVGAPSAARIAAGSWFRHMIYRGK
jgi:hypothetical protein